MDSRRSERVAQLIHARLSQLLLEEISDPSLKDIYITRVKITPDLRQARIYFGIQGAKVPLKEVTRGFHRARSFLRRRLGEEIELRYTPELEFEQDISADGAMRVLELIEENSRTL